MMRHSIVSAGRQYPWGQIWMYIADLVSGPDLGKFNMAFFTGEYIESGIRIRQFRHPLIGGCGWKDCPVTLNSRQRAGSFFRSDFYSRGVEMGKIVLSVLSVVCFSLLSGCAEPDHRVRVAPLANNPLFTLGASASTSLGVSAGISSGAQSAPLPSPNTINPPAPISGNGGKYMSPFTATGAVAPWAVKVEATTDNGSDLAGNVGGAVGQEVGRRALGFVPFGLGGMVGNQLGSQAGRNATRTAIPPRIPSAEEARATSDISFKTANELAVYMYAKHSGHSEYARILELTKTVYPELAQVYASAIARAAQSSDHEGNNQTASGQHANKRSAQTKLKLLQKLKEDGLISDIEFQAKRSNTLFASAMAQAGNNQAELNASGSGRNPHEKLKSLQKMKTDGSITETEFQAKRGKILDAL